MEQWLVQMVSSKTSTSTQSQCDSRKLLNLAACFLIGKIRITIEPTPYIAKINKSVLLRAVSDKSYGLDSLLKYFLTQNLCLKKL